MAGSTDPRYPIGNFTPPGRALTDGERQEAIGRIEETPAHLRDAVRGLSAALLAHPYREGGWSVRQVVHHVPDSHMNAYVRFKLALTEEEPTVKAYEESRWAELPDAACGDVDVSLALLDALHARWVMLLRSLSAEQFLRAYRRPDGELVTLDEALALYAWHGRHHVAHITALRERMGWR